jgi:hypothetical protein
MSSLEWCRKVSEKRRLFSRQSGHTVVVVVVVGLGSEKNEGIP